MATTIRHIQSKTKTITIAMLIIFIGCDVKSHQLLFHLERGSETRCSLNEGLSMQAKLVTAWFEAIGTMKPFGREGRAAR